MKRTWLPGVIALLALTAAGCDDDDFGPAPTPTIPFTSTPAAPPTATPVPPTATTVPATATAIPATATATPVPPTATPSATPTTPFTLVEASVDDIHAAITSGRATCADIVEGYVARAAAYNGVCTWLVTADGAPVDPVPGVVRAGAPIEFPTDTVPVADVFPDYDQYAGPPFEFGRMVTTAADPTVWKQDGMRVGIPDAGQLNALETLNLRGERSVSCKGACDAALPAALPEGCPSGCEMFRRQPDALERAAELDAEYGSSPPLDELPMYCIPVAFKDPYDTKDMRSTSNSDVAFDMDAPPFDSTLAARFRARGAIIYAKSSAHEFNAGPGNPGGPAVSTTLFPSGVHALSGWSGQACNPYDTTREPRGSSSGVGVAVGANLAPIAVCEQTSASCQGPASRNNIVNVLATSGVLPDSGGIGNDFFVDKPGIFGKTVRDAVIALDALRDPESGSYYDTNTIYTAIPKSIVPDVPYASFLFEGDPDSKPLAGMRIALVREWMVKHAPNDSEIVDLINEQAKTVLRDRLGAELVETFDPGYPDDPEIPNVSFTFQDAFAEIFPQIRSEAFTRTSGGSQFYGVPGVDVTSYDYLLGLSLGVVDVSPNLNLRNIFGGTASTLNVKFNIERYLKQRGDAKITDWAAWVANAKFRQDASRAGAENWVATTTNIDVGKDDLFALSRALQLALIKVLRQNDIDVLINPENTLPPRRIGGASDPTISGRGPVSCCGGMTPRMQTPQIVVPAGYVRNEYAPKFALNAARNNYVGVQGTESTPLPHPMPISLMFWAGPGDDPKLIRVASAYEAATKHRVPPPDFGPVPGEQP